MFQELQNSKKEFKTIYHGWSGTTIFFGPFVFLFRGLYTELVLWMVLAILSNGVSSVILVFLINPITLKYYFDNGYQPYGKSWSPKIIDLYGLINISEYSHTNHSCSLSSNTILNLKKWRTLTIIGSILYTLLEISVYYQL